MTRRLAGRRLLLTRPLEAALRWARALEDRGAETVVLPCVRVEPLVQAGDLDRLVVALGRADWIGFSSSRAVHILADVLGSRDLGAVRIAAVGPATAAAARSRFGRANLVAAVPSGASLGDALAGAAAREGGRVLVAGSRSGLRAIDDRLEASGADWERIDVCDTRPAPGGATRHNLSALGIDTVIVASPSAVTGLSRRAEVPRDVRVAAIGPTTARAVREAGLGEPVSAATPDLRGLLEVL